MKKFFVACAIVLGAGLFSSCGDTNFCYEVTVTVNLLGAHSSTTYFWGTSNELKAYEADLKKTQTDLGIDENTIQISSKRTSRSQAECRPAN